jgi:hypothetical protein
MLHPLYASTRNSWRDVDSEKSMSRLEVRFSGREHGNVGKPQLTKFLDILKARRPAFDEPLAQANASMAQYLSWPRSGLGDAMSGVVTSPEPQSLNTGHATRSSSFDTNSVAHSTPVEQTRSRRSLSVNPSISSDMTQMIDGARASNHEQSSRRGHGS